MHTLVTQLGKLDVFTENVTRWMRIGLVRTFRPENAHVNRCSQGYATMAVDLARLYTCNLSNITNVSHHRGSNFFLDHMQKHLIFTKQKQGKSIVVHFVCQNSEWWYLCANVYMSYKALLVPNRGHDICDLCIASLSLNNKIIHLYKLSHFYRVYNFFFQIFR